MLQPDSCGARRVQAGDDPPHGQRSDKWIEEMRPALESYMNSGTGSVVKAIEDARSKRLDNVASSSPSGTVRRWQGDRSCTHG
jgi:hypothetical protein